MSTKTLPPGLPPLPPVPDGFDRWEYRGIAWSTEHLVRYAFFNEACEGEWSVWTVPVNAGGSTKTHYLEAVRETPPAEPAPQEQPPRQEGEGLSVESMYLKVCAAALECDPIPASKREDDRLEPPWEVMLRMKAEKEAAERRAADAEAKAKTEFDIGTGYHTKWQRAEAERDRLLEELRDIRDHQDGNRYNYAEITQLIDAAMSAPSAKGGES